MAKILKGLVAISVLILTSAIIFAQTPQSEERPSEFVSGKETLKEKIEKARELLAQKRLEIQNKIEAQKEILAKRLAKISEQKRKIVERIYERVNELNKRITDHYLEVLERLAKILEKIESRVEKFKAQGADTTEVEKAVEIAKTKIEKAREAVIAQAQKVYSAPQITTEKNLRLNVGVIRKQLHNDLKGVEKIVKEARSAVQNCAILLAKVAETKEKIATPTEATPTSP